MGDTENYDSFDKSGYQENQLPEVKINKAYYL